MWQRSDRDGATRHLTRFWQSGILRTIRVHQSRLFIQERHEAARSRFTIRGPVWQGTL